MQRRCHGWIAGCLMAVTFAGACEAEEVARRGATNGVGEAAESVDENPAANRHGGIPLHVAVSATYRKYDWFPGIFTVRGDESDLLLLFDESFASYEGSALVFWRTWPLGFFRMEGPLNASASQAAMFEVSERNEATMKRVEAGILFGWIPWVRDAAGFWPKVVGSLQYVHSEESFFGRAVALQTFAYVPYGTRAQANGPNEAVVEDLTTVRRADDLSFESRLINDEISLVWAFVKADDLSVRAVASLYATQLDRPSDVNREWTLSDNGLPVVFGTRFASRGVGLGGGGHLGDRISLHGFVMFRMGLDNSMDTAVGDAQPGESLSYASVFADASLRCTFRRESFQRLTAYVGWSFEDRRYGASLWDAWNLEGEIDDLYRTYAGLTVSF